MGRAIEAVAGFATNPGATLTTLTASTGTSFTIRGTDTTKGTWLLGAWAFNATAGELRITSPRLHDQVQGIRNRITAALAAQVIGGPVNAGYTQRLYAQDNLTVQLSGGGAELDTATLLVAYDDLAGVAGRFIDQPTLKKAGQNVVTAEVTVTAVASGNFGGAVAINSTNDNLIANTDYAILGGMTDTRGDTVGIVGVDLGNLKLGFPAEPSFRNATQNFFQQLSMAFNAPYIPVINSANKAATNIDVQTNGAGGTYIINLQLVQLAPGAVPPATPPGAGGTQPGP
jgi:hypothetical protein